MQIKKILIANRGEIARRIIKACRKLNIASVAIFSDPDANAMFVKEADEAVSLGGNFVSDSYLNMDKIVSICKEYGVDAVHPGYGLLSENYKFCELLEKNNITFIGPSKESIFDMGDKIRSKLIAKKAGVNTIPGFEGNIENHDQLKDVAKKIGYPVMLKASAGGGGKGMRIVYEESNIVSEYENAKMEGLRSFGDDAMLIEKFIEEPRHIEIQVIADKHGNVVCLGERDCSVQRFNQKVVEESPSPFMTDAVRKKMYEQSKKLAEACKYYSAGTVEYVMDKDRNFYFLEMNTRLQVEHPVTEYVTDKDLVELMIRVAEGSKLPFTQKDVKLNGHAIEVRVCAEDTSLGFAPSSGRITYARMPQEKSDVRLDFGVKEGDEISPFYDSMIGKLIVHGTDRPHAIDRMKRALAKLDIEGVASNIDFLESILRHPNFVTGDFNTSFVKKYYNNKFSPSIPEDGYNIMFIASALVLFLEQERQLFKIESQIRMYEKLDYHRLCVMVNDKQYKINITNYDSSKLSFHIGLEHYEFENNYELGMKYVSGVLNGEMVSVKSKKSAGGWNINLGGFFAKVRVMTWDKADIVNNIKLKDKISHQKNRLSASISGVINSIAKEGDVLKSGMTICAIEAMKMLNNITVESNCIVKKVHKKTTDRVGCGDLLVELEITE